MRGIDDAESSADVRTVWVLDVSGFDGVAGMEVGREEVLILGVGVDVDMLNVDGRRRAVSIGGGEELCVGLEGLEDVRM